MKNDMGEKVLVVARVPVSIHQRLRKQATEEGRTAAAILRDAMRGYLAISALQKRAQEELRDMAQQALQLVREGLAKKTERKEKDTKGEHDE